MTENLPANNSPSQGGNGNGRSDGGRFLSIGQFHYHGNDLAELRKLAEVDAGLADKVIEQRDAEHARQTASHNFGVICTVVLLGMVLVAFTCMIIFAGIIATAIAVGGILSVAVLVRVILTGEWSDTTWFGSLLNVLVKALGGKTEDEDSATS